MTPALEIVLEPGEILYSEGDANDFGYIIAEGEVVLYRGSSATRADCERRGAGSIIGELSILTGQARLVTVEAVTKSVFYRISGMQISRLFDQVDPVLRACIETSISFTARLNQNEPSASQDVPLAPSTLKNADQLIERFRFEKDIIEGLKSNEFYPVFQPIVSLTNQEIIGFETLMRWEHPTLGNIPPDRFIDVAENMGAISEITDFAIIQTCKALKCFKAKLQDSRDLFATVNISGEDLGRRHFVDFISYVLDLNDIAPTDLKLEVTERALVPDSEHAEANLRRLKKLGCGIAIDDFGTGYSNLGYLKQLPLTALKIDRTFAGDANSSSVSRSIVRMLLSLGGELGVDVIAEGLETKEDVETLQALGCKYAQGYFFSRPVNADDFSDLISLRTVSRLNVA
jgi:EAL domain-containing protein (putative c-di-GMP-specific phosphodiesterase class I)